MLHKKLLSLTLLLLLAAGLFSASSCGGRETIDLEVCSVSGLLPSENCKTRETREYYKVPEPGDTYKRPTETCAVCKPDDPEPPDPEKVKVIVCTVSGRLPNEYCATIEREFLPANVPVNKCVTCKAPWPAKAKYPLYVFVPELMVAHGDIDAFMVRMRKAGVWGVRIFLLQSWSSIRLVPWEQATYNGKLVYLNKPAEGVNNCPVTDMTRPNAAYWTRLDEIIALAKKNDLEIIASLGDNCSLSPRQSKLSYPFLASLQTMSIECKAYIQPAAAWSKVTESPGGLYGVAKFDLYRKWVKDIITAMNKSGITYRLEIQNEFSRLDWEPAAKEPANWYAMMVKAITDNGIPAARIVHSGDQSITLLHGGIFAMHQIEQAGMNDTTCPMSRLMLSGDGGYAGKWKGRSTIDVDAVGRHGVSAEDAVAIAKMIRTKGIAGGYEWMPKSTNKRSDFLANVDDCTDAICVVPVSMTAEWAK